MGAARGYTQHAAAQKGSCKVLVVGLQLWRAGPEQIPRRARADPCAALVPRSPSMRCFDGAWRRAFTGLRLWLLLGAADAFRVSIDLNTFTSVELAYATSHFTALNGTMTLTINSWHNGSATLPDDAQWRAALAAIGSEQFSEEMWPCSEAANAEWHCSDITQGYDASHGQCNAVRQLAPKGELAGAFAYHEVGAKPYTALTWEEIDEVSSACGGCKVLLHTRRYAGQWKEVLDWGAGASSSEGCRLRGGCTAARIFLCAPL